MWIILGEQLLPELLTYIGAIFLTKIYWWKHFFLYELRGKTETTDETALVKNEKLHRHA